MADTLTVGAANSYFGTRELNWEKGIETFSQKLGISSGENTHGQTARTEENYAPSDELREEKGATKKDEKKNEDSGNGRHGIIEVIKRYIESRNAAVEGKYNEDTYNRHDPYFAQ